MVIFWRRQGVLGRGYGLAWHGGVLVLRPIRKIEGNLLPSQMDAVLAGDNYRAAPVRDRYSAALLPDTLRGDLLPEQKEGR